MLLDADGDAVGTASPDSEGSYEFKFLDPDKVANSKDVHWIQVSEFASLSTKEALDIFANRLTHDARASFQLLALRSKLQATGTS